MFGRDRCHIQLFEAIEIWRVAITRNSTKGFGAAQFSFDDYDNVIGFVVSQAGYRLSQALANAIESLGSDLRPREFAILNRLHERGELTQIQLAELTYKDKPAITRMLERLITRKLVRKVTSPSDRRAMVVSLTPEGEAMRDAIVPLTVQFLETACEGVSPENLAITVATLKRISAQI
ncbi:MAG: MarR family transcriptional regulator [Rhodospirillales bacterium]|nr:MarR family transcriptional regulator [Rhodospirillales bacterium]